MFQNPESLDISIVILNFNTKEVLINCLRSVYEQTSGIDFEVIVVDNASSDGSAEEAKKLFPQIRLKINDANLGFSAGNNKGPSGRDPFGRLAKEFSVSF